ncbi:RHS repeat-associated core domain-containing protein [Tenuifilum osseticum]|uniref:RHS repeat-associated core domain-containing protein n=1 Tax=Tenuifilum osseticum TaxID=3374723 RepID=UPI0034E5A998
MLKGTGVQSYYAGGFVYKANKTLDYILHAEGVIRATDATGGQTLSFEYFLKYHLGNTRVVFKSSGTVLQTTDYYPFGKEHAPLPISNGNRYLYNGKEKQEFKLSNSSLDWYDYGRRFYNPQLGRFTTIDPLAEKFPWQSPYCYAGNNPIRFIDYNGLGPGDRVKAARSMTGIKYKQETVSSMRTANTAEARQYMDCAEFVCRVLGADQITDGVQHMNSSGLKSYFDNKDKFISSADPQVGDIAVWKGHVGVVTEVGEDGKIKLTHARGAGKLSMENPYAIYPEQYRDSEFYGYYRPVTETPDGKIDNNGNPVTTNNQSTNSTGSFDLTPQPETAVQDNTRVANNSFIQQINNLPQGNYKVVNGQIAPQ